MLLLLLLSAALESLLLVLSLKGGTASAPSGQTRPAVTRGASAKRGGGSGKSIVVVRVRGSMLKHISVRHQFVFVAMV